MVWGPPAFPGAIISAPWPGISGCWPRICRPTAAPRRPWTATTRWPGRFGAILDFLDRRGIEQAALAGNSLGGGLALLLARDYPERFPALVLLAPAAALTRVPWIFYPLRLPRLGRLAAACLGPWIIPPALRLIYHRRELITPEVIAGYAAPFREFPRRLALGRLCRQLNPCPWPRSNLSYKTNPAAGEPHLGRAGPHPAACARPTGSRHACPSAQLHILPQVGHAPQEEAPAEVNKIIIAFLDRSINN